MSTPIVPCPLKRCTKCGNEYPATAEYFFRANARKDGLQRWCKPCHTAHCRAYKQEHPEETRARKRAYYHKDIEATHARQHKYYAANKDRFRAYRAEYNKNLTDEQRARRREYGRIRMAKWRAENPERARQSFRRHYYAHRDQHISCVRDWERRNPERVAAWRVAYNQTDPRKQQNRDNVKRWSAKNPDKVRAYATKWRANNPERRREIVSASSQKRRARKRKSNGSFTRADLAAIRAAQTDKRGRLRCWWCGKPVEGTPHLDHKIALAAGGTNDPGNLCYACGPCNVRKNTKSPAEFAGRLL